MVVHWTTNGTAQDFFNNYTARVIRYLKNSDVYLVIDRYYPQNITGVTRTVIQSDQVIQSDTIAGASVSA